MHVTRLLFFAALLAMTPTAQAGLVRFDFAGSLTQAFGTVASGTPFSGSLVFETAQVGTEIPSVPATVGLAYGYESFRFEIGGVTFERGSSPVPALGVEVFADPTYGPTSIVSARLADLPGGSQILGGREVWRLDVWLYSLGNVIADNNALPTDASFFQQGGEGLLFFRFVGEQFQEVTEFDGRINSLTSTPVPLPAMMPMFMVCLMLLGTRTSRTSVIREP